MSRLYFPATQRNRQPIWELLKPQLRVDGTYLEVASGSGEHISHFASQPEGRRVHWIPSDPSPEHRNSIADWCQDLENVANPLDIDCRQHPWKVPTLDGILAINLVHISPWSATLGLLTAARHSLRPDGWLYLYGAYFCDDLPTAPSNLAFDRSLREQNPDWGVRHLDEVTQAALDAGLVLIERVPMPANNLSLKFIPYASRGPHTRV